MSLYSQNGYVLAPGAAVVPKPPYQNLLTGVSHGYDAGLTNGNMSTPAADYSYTTFLYQNIANEPIWLEGVWLEGFGGTSTSPSYSETLSTTGAAVQVSYFGPDNAGYSGAIDTIGTPVIWQDSGTTTGAFAAGGYIEGRFNKPIYLAAGEWARIVYIAQITDKTKLYPMRQVQRWFTYDAGGTARPEGVPAGQTKYTGGDIADNTNTPGTFIMRNYAEHLTARGATTSARAPVATSTNGNYAQGVSGFFCRTVSGNRVKSVGVVGDSTAIQGYMPIYQAGSTKVGSAVQRAANALNWAFTGLAKSGSDSRDLGLVSRFQVRGRNMQNLDVLFVQIGVNDFILGRTISDLQNALYTFCAFVRRNGTRVVLIPPLPDCTSTTGFTTLAGQADANATYTTKIKNFLLWAQGSLTGAALTSAGGDAAITIESLGCSAVVSFTELRDATDTGRWKTFGATPLATGTFESASGSTATDSDAAWTPNLYRGCCLHTIAGTGSGQYLNIVSNTATVLQFSAAPGVALDATTTFEIVPRITDDGLHMNAYGIETYATPVIQALLAGM